MRIASKTIEFLLLLGIGFILLASLGGCFIIEDRPKPPADVCEASAFEFCDRAVDCGQIGEASRSECEAWIVKGYCVAPGEWSQCEAALDELSCPVDNRPVEAACWNVP